MIENASDTYGPYKAERMLSAGAHAQVWLARGPTGLVALKIARSDAHRDTLLREVRAYQGLSHPNLVRVVDKASDASWVAFERVDGIPMDRWAESHAPAEVAAVAVQVIDALRHLHNKGIVHGDLKPRNVLVDVDNQCKVLDLGIATLPGETVVGFRGTPGYAAPEVLRGERPTAAADVYGLGGLLYASLTHRPPFVAPDPAALAYLPLVSLPTPPSSFRPDLPALLNQLVLTLLARDPARRPQSLTKIEEALRRVNESLPVSPVIGMHDEREQLRRAVIGSADGECRVVVLYGPPGSGRRTLLTEAVEAARREGLPYIPEGGDLQEVYQKVRKSKRPPVVALRANQPSAIGLARTLLDQSTPALVFVHADRPISLLDRPGASQITPAPFAKDDAEVFVRQLGGDVARAAEWWRESFGHPASIAARVRASKRVPGVDAPDADLPSQSRLVLQAIRRVTEGLIPDLARRAGMSEHELLDHCEVLFAEGVIEPTQNGAAIRVTGLARRAATQSGD